MKRLILLVSILTCLLPRGAIAKEEQKPALKLDDLLVKEDELPAGGSVVSGMHCVSTQPVTIFSMPAMGGLLPTPEKKMSQSLKMEGGKAGTVLIFQYEKRFPRSLKDSFLSGLLWGDDGGPTARHPEEVIIYGRFLFIVSFPRGDPASEWWKARLRSRFRIPAPRDHSDLADLIGRLGRSYDEPAAGLKLFVENKKKLAGSSFAQYLRGELAIQSSEYETAEMGYGRAMELHDSLEDPLGGDPRLIWACLDGYGIALIAQQKYEACSKVLERAAKVAEELDPKETAQTNFNLACCYARLRRYEDSLTQLELAIKANPKYRKSARTDGDLAEAVKREEFKKLLAD